MFPRNYLSACLCFRNSASYLAEWLGFYTVMGVEHFYLYNNDSTDQFHEVIDPYIARGSATLVNYPGQGIQHAVYTHCLKTYGSRTRWMMFSDDDEFLFPTKDVSLCEVLQHYEPFAGVAVAWMLFGSSGHKTRPPGFVVENYTFRFAVPDQHVKCVVDPARIIEPIVVSHQFRCIGDEVVVDENGEPMTGPFLSRPSADILRINHYLCKSHEELVARRKRIQVNTGKISPLSVDEYLKLEASWNVVEDRLATRYLNRMNDAIKRGQVDNTD